MAENGELTIHSQSYHGSTRWISFLILVWFVTSSAAVLVTKSLFSGTYNIIKPFPFGLLVTATNNIIAWGLSYFIVGSNDLLKEKNIRQLSMVIGCTTAGEIGLSNIALNLLSVSYATILKGMAPLFVMTWGILLGIQKVRIELMVCMSFIIVGVILTVTGNVTGKLFQLSIYNVGFILQLLSGILSGFRWTLIQIFIKNEHIDFQNLNLFCCFFIKKIKPLSSSHDLSIIEIIQCTSPFTILTLIPTIILIEGPHIIQWFSDITLNELTILSVILSFIGLCVLALLWAEYELVRVTSSLTVSVTFVLKEILVIYVGKLIFNDALSVTTWLGFFIVQVGVVGYALDRRRVARKEVVQQHSENQP